jgi:hypothetical protein
MALVVPETGKEIEAIETLPLLTQVGQISPPPVELFVGHVAHLRDEIGPKLGKDPTKKRLSIVSGDERQYVQ